MHIFFAGSIRGGRGQQPKYSVITEALKRYGSVHSQFTHEESLSDFGETRHSDDEIHKREIDALLKADRVVAEVTTPSLGVGYLIARATELRKEVLALYQGEDTLRLSAMIKGNPHVRVSIYQTDEDIENIIDGEFAQET